MNPVPEGDITRRRAVIEWGRRGGVRTIGLAVSVGRDGVYAFGGLTARWRPDPEFLIIGAKRGGSTSFYFDLLHHPQICPLYPRPSHLPKAAATKGIHYFDQNYERGERWYRAHLPTSFVRDRQARTAGRPVITGEASPYYLFHPAAAERASALLPSAKIIAVLRDPVMRTYSHWKERRRNNLEALDFQDALAAEDDRIGDDELRLQTEPGFHSYAHEQLSYARQSEYAPALERWYQHYPHDRVLILSSEEYYADPQGQLNHALDFLGLPQRDLSAGVVRNAAGGDVLDPAIAQRLAERFAPHNARLVELTGRKFPWA